jgi:hypothetical protein
MGEQYLHMKKFFYWTFFYPSWTLMQFSNPYSPWNLVGS